MSKSALPHWDLSPIYPSVTSDEFRSALSSLSVLSDKLRGQIKAASPLYEVIQTINTLESTYVTLSAYTSCLLSTDTSNGVYIKAASDVENASLAVDEALQLFTSAIASYEKEFSDPRLSDYRFFLEHTLEESRHQMSLAEEALAADLARSGANAWSRLFDSVTSSIGDGEKTVIQLRNDANSPDRELRRTSYYREKQIWKTHEVAIAGALNGVKGSVLTLEKRRGWKSPLEHSAFISRISMKALEALIHTIEKNLPAFRRYYNIKARLLGIDKLAWYDLFAPVGTSHREYSFDAARDMVVKCYSGFSADMGAFAAKAFSENWIDAEPRKGKVGGAYDTSFPDAGVSRILSNFDGSYSSVLTLAHELGHAYHDSAVLTQPALLADYPMTVAETASIFAEQVVFQEYLKEADENEAVQAIEQFIGDSAQVCVDILSRFYFESSVFEKRADGELTPEEFSALMLDAQERSYGDAVCEKHEHMWAVKSHYYSPYFSFYNYPYAFGQLFALALFSRSRREPDFASSYKQLLASTGRLSANEVAASAGCDIESEAFWQEGLDVIISYIDILEKSCE